MTDATTAKLQPEIPGRRNRWLVVVAALVVLALALRGGWWLWQTQRQKLIVNLIPTDALALVEVSQPDQTLGRLQKANGWSWLADLDEIKQLKTSYQAIKQALGPDSGLVNLTTTDPGYVSVHLTGKQDLGYVVYLPLVAEGDLERFKQITTRTLTRNRLKQKPRRYKGQDILDIALTDTTMLSVLPMANYWAVSLHGNLIDDVARQVKETTTANWLDALHETSGPLSEADGLRWVLNGDRMAALLGVATTGQTAPLLNGVIGSALMKPVWGGDGIRLVGHYQSTADDLLDSAGTGGTEALQWVPHNTARLIHIADGAMVHRWLTRQRTSPNAGVGNVRVQPSIPDENLYRQWGELAIADLEHPDPTERPVLLIARSTNPELLQDWFNQAAKPGAQLITGNLGNNPWRQWTNGDFGATMIGYPVHGLEEAFFTTTADGWLLAASSLTTLSQVLQDHQEGQTWQRDAAIAPYLGTLADHHQALVAIHPSRSYALAEQGLQKWLLPVADRWLAPETGVGFVLLQASRKSDDPDGRLVQVNISRPPAETSNNDPAIKNLRATWLPGLLLGGPKVWRNPEDKGLGVVVADTANQLSFINKKGVLVSQYDLRQPLVTDLWRSAEPISWQEGQQVQWFAATLGGLHLLKPDGSLPAKAPIRLPDTLTPVSASHLLYGDGTGIRWQVNEHTGATWLFDKDGKALAPFNPLRFGSRLVGPMQHLQVAGQDILIALEQKGILHLLNRKGEPLNGWPKDLGYRCFHQPMLKAATTPSQSLITVLTEQGQVITYNVNGQTVKQLQLYRNSGATRFGLFIEPQQLTYSLTAAEGDSIIVYDPTGERLARFTGPGYGQADVQYYHFGAGNQVWAIRPPANATGGQSLVWLHTRDALLGGGTALRADFAVSLLYSEASKAWFVLRNAGHITALTAVRKVAATDQTPQIFAEDNLQYARKIEPLKLGKDTLPHIPWTASNRLVISPPQMGSDRGEFRSVATMMGLMMLWRVEKQMVAPKAKASLTVKAPTTTAAPDKHDKTAKPAKVDNGVDKKAAIKPEKAINKSADKQSKTTSDPKAAAKSLTDDKAKVAAKSDSKASTEKSKSATKSDKSAPKGSSEGGKKQAATKVKPEAESKSGSKIAAKPDKANDKTTTKVKDKTADKPKDTKKSDKPKSGAQKAKSAPAKAKKAVKKESAAQKH